MSWLATNWPALGALLGMAGLGGVFIAALRILSGHLKMVRDADAVKRKQSDTVALDLVETLTGRMAALEAAQVQERRYCEARLSALSMEVRNELTFSDTLVLAIRHAPGEAIAIIDDATRMREARREAEREAQRQALIDEVTILPAAAAAA